LVTLNIISFDYFPQHEFLSVVISQNTLNMTSFDDFPQHEFFSSENCSVYIYIYACFQDICVYLTRL